MTLSELFTIVVVFGGLMVVIISQRRKKNPQAFNWFSSWLSSKNKLKKPDFTDTTQQVWPEKRQIM